MRLNTAPSFLAACLVFGRLLAIPVMAQQQEANSAGYRKWCLRQSPLATAANDGGLIAQTLPGCWLRCLWRPRPRRQHFAQFVSGFREEGEEFGPGTVAVVYLPGYAMQLAGENYFIPVDTTMARDTDIPIEGLRLSDYMRQLSASPSKLVSS